jgi:hypothetical protein
VSDRIFGDEFKQAGIAEIVCALEKNVAMDEVGVLCEQCAQGGDIAGVDHIHSAAKYGVLDALVVLELETVGEGGLLNVALEAGPTRETGLAGYGKLGVAEAQREREDLGVGGAGKFGMEFAEALCGAEVVCGMRAEKVFGLVFEVVEAGLRRETANGHRELPFVCPGPHVKG